MQRRPALTRILAAERLCRGPSLEEDARETSSDSEMGRRSSKQKCPGSSRVPSSAGKSSSCEERSCGVSGVVDGGPVSAAGVGAVEAAAIPGVVTLKESSVVPNPVSRCGAVLGLAREGLLRFL